MKVNILGVEVDNLSPSETIDIIGQWFSVPESNKKHYLVTPNPEMVVRAQKDSLFRHIVNRADLAVPDGIGLVFASKLLYSFHQSLKERITGVDLMDKMCLLAAEKGLTVGFLGGAFGVADKVARVLKTRYPRLRVVFVYSGDGEPKGDQEIVNQMALQLGASSRVQPDSSSLPMIDFLFIAFGFPKQELWIGRNLGKITARVAMGVGGAFDFISGAKKRAPAFAQRFGLEWLWRLFLEPWRVKRQLALLRFGQLVLQRAIFKRV